VAPAAGLTEATDPLFGYNPAVNGIVDRLKNVLADACLPQKLDVDACGNVECLILVTLLDPTKTCADLPGMVPAPAAVLQTFQKNQHDAWIAGGMVGTDPSTLPTCELQQLSQLPSGTDPALCAPPVGTFDAAGSCAASSEPGWCYVEGAAAGLCSQSILFSAGQPPSGTVVSLQCIESSQP
jgi:hypothetical protein